MKARRFFLCIKTYLRVSICLLLVKGRLGRAGEIELEKKEAIPVDNPERWQFKPGSPSWLAGVYGDVGVNGDTSHISLEVDTILRHVDFTAAFEGEARKG
ncbi:MAG: hypothetical protein JWL90_4401, partial [Chthoniobacteraceae bacterium]|nr:hypothetical protein [Chthoniobacteraceae bacterium]